MARDTWPGKLWESDPQARAWVEDFRGSLDRLAAFFDWEPVEAGAREPLPNFRAKWRPRSHSEISLATMRLKYLKPSCAKRFRIAWMLRSTTPPESR